MLTVDNRSEQRGWNVWRQTVAQEKAMTVQYSSCVVEARRHNETVRACACVRERARGGRLLSAETAETAELTHSWPQHSCCVGEGGHCLCLSLPGTSICLCLPHARTHAHHSSHSTQLVMGKAILLTYRLILFKSTHSKESIIASLSLETHAKPYVLNDHLTLKNSDAFLKLCI